MNLENTVKKASQILKNHNIYSHELDAQIILSDIMGVTKEFLITVLHEIHHALQRKKLGAKKYEKEYYIAGELAQQKGGDFHDDNKFEEEAEEWARKEVSKVLKKYK